MAERNPQEWEMAIVSDADIVSQGKINDCYSFATIPIVKTE